MSRHSSSLDASASNASDLSTAHQPLAHQPLTRRELRERERLNQTLAETPELSGAAGVLVAAERTESNLRLAVLAESGRVIVAPPAGEIAVMGYGVPTDTAAATTSAGIPVPSRAPTRSQRPANGASRAQPASGRSGSARRSAQSNCGRARRFATQGVSVAAMAFVALMAVSTSVPAEALLSSADVRAAANEAQKPTQSEPAQSLDLASGTDTITVERDGYESKSIAEVAAASGIRMEATFTNNPSGTIQWPFAVGVHIGDRFGYRDCAGCSVDHHGQDFNPGLDAPIQAIADGVVSYTEDGEGSLGVHMVIDHMIDGELVSSVYAHMEHGSMLFAEGDPVKAGQVIGRTGSTGMSTGPHLHFEIRIGGRNGTHVDPLEWLYAHTD